MDLQDRAMENRRSALSRREVLRFGSAGVLATSAGCLGGRLPTSGEPPTTSAPETSLQVHNRACTETGNEGTLTPSDENTVVATGTVLGDSTCDDLVLGLFSNQEDSEFIVELTVRSGTDGECTECKTGLDYEATVTFPGGIPSAVHLVYDTRHGSMALDALKND